MLEEKYRSLSKWIIRVVTVCILIYLGIRHADSVAMGMAWLLGLVSPLLTGGLLALVLSVPMETFEKRLFQKRNGKMRLDCEEPWRSSCPYCWYLACSAALPFW